ncbi:MAG: DUF1295 domain-containing protein [Acidobacteriota bacterium]|nr:DUF1295 domain-containing protein [Acidobacteriota bacterium]
MSLLQLYLIAGLVILCINTLLWLVSLPLKNASIIDPVWSLLFLAAALVPFVSGFDQLNPRQILIMTLVIAWSLRLALYLTWRNWGEGEDFRYKKWREAAGPPWWWLSYFKVFVLQGVLAWIICIPLLAAQVGSDSALGLLDLVAVAVWFVGFAFETLGDWQLTRFRGNPDNKGKVLNTGVWRYTRHPNYFGDAAQWWGFYLITVSAGAWWTLYAPLLMTGLLLKVSGVVLLEKTLVKTKPQYKEYIETTPAFFPWFPKKSGS